MNVPFITYREPDEFNRLCFYILQKAYPNFIGLLITHPREGAIVNAPIPGYNIWVTYSGVLIGNYVPALRGVENDITQVFYSMAEWYYLNRIKTNPKKYKSFKINDTTSTAG